MEACHRFNPHHTMSVPAEILELVTWFELHQEAYKSGQHNEAQLRRVYDLYGLNEEELAIVEGRFT